MKNVIIAVTIAALLAGLVFFTLIQFSKQYDSVYQSNRAMIEMHKLDINE